MSIKQKLESEKNPQPQMLKENEEIHDISEKKELTPEERLDQLGIFSIQQFLKTASDEFELKEGNWFRSTTFLMGLDYILERNPGVIEGIDLQVYNMNDNIIFLKDLFEKIFEPIKGDTVKLGELTGLKEMGVTEMKLSDIMNMDNINLGLNKKEEEEPEVQQIKKSKENSVKNESCNQESSESKNDIQPKINFELTNEEDNIMNNQMTFCPSNYESNTGFDFEKVSDYLDFLRTNEISKPLLLCLNTMLGLNEIDSCHESFLRSLFQLPSFVGMLGGKEFKAFYFFGHDHKYFYYLDPHYVKSSHGDEYQDEHYIKDYFLKTIFKMKYKSIAPSLSLCFLIQKSEGT